VNAVIYRVARTFGSAPVFGSSAYCRSTGLCFGILLESNHVHGLQTETACHEYGNSTGTVASRFFADLNGRQGKIE
jgi:hypothetical protein